MLIAFDTENRKNVHYNIMYCTGVIFSTTLLKHVKKEHRLWKFQISPEKKYLQVIFRTLVSVGESEVRWATLHILYPSAEMKAVIPKLNGVSKTLQCFRIRKKYGPIDMVYVKEYRRKKIRVTQLTFGAE